MDPTSTPSGPSTAPTVHIDPTAPHPSTDEYHAPPLSPLRISALRRSSTRKRSGDHAKSPSKLVTTNSFASANNDALDSLIRSPGAEPGIDPRKESHIRAYSNIKEECEIEVIDYSAEHIKFRQFNNEEFLSWLSSKDSERNTDGTKNPIAQGDGSAPGNLGNQANGVRWLNIAGISWDIIAALAIKYSLHPLSIEDVFHSRSNSRSKADYYRSHLFLRVLCNSISARKASPLRPEYLKDDATISSFSETEEEEEELELEIKEEEVREEDINPLQRVVSKRKRRKQTAESIKPAKSLKWMDAALLLSAEGRKRSERLAKLNALKKKDRVRVFVSNFFIWLFRDGTVISIHSSDRSFGDPIYARLRHPDTVLRKDPEGSLLVHTLLDLCVDQALEVVEKYEAKITELETDILLKPSMEVVRGLHILSADLASRKRNMRPLKNLVYVLRRFDAERTAVAMGIVTSSWGVSIPTDTKGYMSSKSKVYLADVHDHLESILSSLDQYSTMVDNLVDFAFNMSSSNTNMSMAKMTILIAVFFPLTFLTGYFGQNFHPLKAVNDYSEALFWEIAFPVMAVLLPLAFWSDIKKMFGYLGRVKILGMAEEKHGKKVAKARKQHRRMSKETQRKTEVESNKAAA